MNTNNSQASLNSFGGEQRTRTSNNNNETSSSTSSSSRSTSICASQAGSYNAQHLNYRSISLIDSIQFQFDGNLSKNGVVLADCDNDNKNELLIGTLNGELLIFKDSSTIPLATTKELGMISCIVVGDILNKKKNNIITISIEGYLNIFAFIFEFHDGVHSASHNPALSRRSSSNVSTSSALPLSSNVKCPPTITDNEEFAQQPHQHQTHRVSSNSLVNLHSQQIQANAMSALIADIDADGANELIVALSDRVVRSYRAVQYGEEVKLVGIHKWEFSDQIGSITLSTSFESFSAVPTETNGNEESGSTNFQEQKSVLVAQHGGMFARVHGFNSDALNNSTELTVVKNGVDGGEEGEEGDGSVDDDEEQQHLIEEQAIIGLRPEYKTITPVPPVRNPQISAEIVADIRQGSKKKVNQNNNSPENLVAVATADGLLLLLDEGGEHIRWQLQLEQKVAALRKHDIDGDERDELVLCTWNGLTYLINADTARIVAAQFEQPVAAFTVGDYFLNGRNSKALVYGTFTSSVHLYYRVEEQLGSGFDTGNSNFSDSGSHQLLNYVRTGHATLAGQLETLVRRLNEKTDTGEEGNDKKTIAADKFKVDAKLIEAILYGVSMKNEGNESGANE